MRSPMRCSPFKNLFEKRIQLVESGAGKKSEAAQVHREDGNVLSVKSARGGKKRAIAAENDDEINFLPQGLARKRRET